MARVSAAPGARLTPGRLVWLGLAMILIGMLALETGATQDLLGGVGGLLMMVSAIVWAGELR